MCKYVCKYTYPVCLFYMTSCSLLKYLRGPPGGAGYTLGITVRKKIYLSVCFSDRIIYNMYGFSKSEKNIFEDCGPQN